ncbi:MAG TPA: HlyD family efflux transporter periplasmic adaptor subunit [Kineosporiaceae bacterium]|nr:HlyD family efflux transporter periplasmic adaptor subunit [Kineosporiaceae bacterium]
MSTATDVASTEVTSNTAAPNTAPPDRPADPPTPARRRRWNWKKWRARLVVLLMIAAAVAGGTRLAEARTGAIAQFDLETVTLTAQPISVESRKTGQITAVNVAPLQKVTEGQRLGTILTSTTSAAGLERSKSVPLTAPADGIVSGEPLPVGSIVQPGVPFVQLYDPDQLTFDTTVRVEDLPRLSPGMTATLRADGLSRPVEAVIQRVVPRVVEPTSGRLPTSQDRLQLVLVPKRAADVTQLIPGLRFTGTVDTSTNAGTATDGLHISS